MSNNYSKLNARTDGRSKKTTTPAKTSTNELSDREAYRRRWQLIHAYAHGGGNVRDLPEWDNR